MELMEKFEYWHDIAKYDLKTAQVMYKTGRWLYVVFMCQQAIEKLCIGKTKEVFKWLLTMKP